MEGVDGPFVVLLAEKSCQAFDLATSAVGESAAARGSPDDAVTVAVRLAVAGDKEFSGEYRNSVHVDLVVREMTVSYRRRQRAA